MHDEIKWNDCSKLSLCNQFHQVNTGTIPGFTTVLPTLNKHDENIDIGSTKKATYGQFSVIVGGYIIMRDRMFFMCQFKLHSKSNKVELK